MKKNSKQKLINSSVFTIAVAWATVLIFFNLCFVVGMVFSLTTPGYELGSRFTFVFLAVMSVLNIAVFILLIVLRQQYESRVNKRIIEPLREIEHHISNFVKREYDEQISYKEDDEIGDLFKAVENVRIQLAEYQKLELELSMRKQVHVSGLMHDIATPVTRINGYASMVIDGIVTEKDDVKRFAEMILQSTEDINVMLKSLSDVEKYNETEIKLNKQPVDLNYILERYLSDLSLELSPKAVDLSYTNKCIGSTVSLLDVKSCKRAFMNLINNSIKYKKPDCDCKINIELSDYDEYSMLFKLSDNGIGVEHGSENIIFEMFYRGDSARRNINEGNGLGLYLTKTILVANGAKVWAENNGNGLSVMVLLPRSDKKPVDWYK